MQTILDFLMDPAYAAVLSSLATVLVGLLATRHPRLAELMTIIIAKLWPAHPLSHERAVTGLKMGSRNYAVLALAGLLLLFAGGAALAQPPACPNGRCPLTPAAATVAPLPMPGPGWTAGPVSGSFPVLRPCQPGEFVHQTPHGPATCTPVTATDVTDAEPVSRRRGARLCDRVRAGVRDQLIADGVPEAIAAIRAERLTDELIREVAKVKRVELPDDRDDRVTAGWLDNHPVVQVLIKILLALLPLIL